MNKALCLLAIVTVLLAAGCGSNSAKPSTSESSTQGTVSQTASHTDVPADKNLSDYCRVCYVMSGHVMPPKEDGKHKLVKNGREYHFCSDWCRDEFQKQPDKYLLKN